MPNPVSRRTLGFDIGQLVKVIAKPIDAASIESRPESRFANRDATHFCKRLVVVGRPRNHVDVRVDIVH